MAEVSLLEPSSDIAVHAEGAVHEDRATAAARPMVQSAKRSGLPQDVSHLCAAEVGASTRHDHATPVR